MNSIQIKSFHPAILTALAGRDTAAMLAAVNGLYDEHAAKNDVVNSVKSKVGKESITFTQATKVTAGLPKNNPAAILARVHWFLESSREYYVRIGQVELPLSVTEWAKAEKFNLPVEEPAK